MRVAASLYLIAHRFEDLPLTQDTRGIDSMRHIARCSIGWLGAVRCRVSPAPCSVLRGACCAAWRLTEVTTASGPVDAHRMWAPPPQLPAPEAPRFSTALQMGPLRHFFAQLSTLAASNVQLSALAKGERAAVKREEKEERAAAKREEQRYRLAELVRPLPQTLLSPSQCPIHSAGRGVIWVACTLAAWRLDCTWWQLPHHIGLQGSSAGLAIWC